MSETPSSEYPSSAVPRAGEGARTAAQTATSSARPPAIDANRVLPPKARVDYLEAALSDFWLERLPNGATIAVKRQAGRKTAAARIALARPEATEGEGQAGYDALALSIAARARAGAEPGSFGLAAFGAGASLELRLEDYDDVALELVCPAAQAAGLLSLVARALEAPAFAPEDFDRALRDARVAERRESGDPLSRAAAELRAGLYIGHPYAVPPRGTAASLAKATREGVMRYWKDSFAAGRLSVVVVGDFEPGPFARALAAAFGQLPTGAQPARARDRPAAARAELPIRPWFKAVPMSAMPGSAVLRGEFSAPAASSPDFPAMTVALAMLDDLLLERLRGEGLAYGAWTRLSQAAAASGSVTVYKTGDPAAAKAAVDAAIADLARGLCVDASPAGKGSPILGPVARSLEAYKARAITAAYAKGASSEGMAARIARDLAAGGDGTSLFRMAGRIQAVKAEDLVRVARQRLLEGPSAWVALGDPELVLTLPSSAFAPGK
jgi:predicted Zn-dependent peptidase